MKMMMVMMVMMVMVMMTTVEYKLFSMTESITFFLLFCFIFVSFFV